MICKDMVSRSWARVHDGYDGMRDNDHFYIGRQICFDQRLSYGRRGYRYVVSLRERRLRYGSKLQEG